MKWQAAEGIGPEWYNLGITLQNQSLRHVYLHLELPALIDSKKNQVMADEWVEGDFVSGLVYSGASIRTNALFSAAKLGERPPGGRIVLTCHERREELKTYHLQARLQGEACFIVTYCFTRESAEYRNMILYRDEILSRTWIGRRIIQLYYFISPHLVHWASRNRTINFLIRKMGSFMVSFSLKT